MEEVQWYLKWSHWGRRLFWLGVALPVALIQFNHGLKVAELDSRFRNELSYAVEHSPPYTQAEVDSIEETLNLQLALKAEFDQIEAQAAEQGWTIEFNAPYQEAALQARKAELAFNAQVKPMVQVWAAKCNRSPWVGFESRFSRWFVFRPEL